MPENLELRNGIWYYRQMIDGTLHRISTGFKKRDLKLAKRFAADKESEIRAGRLGYLPKDIPLYDEWVTTYIAAYHPNRYTEQHLLKRSRARWGTRRIDEFVRSDFETYLREREQAGAADATLERERVLLKSCFEAALADGKLTKNPLAGIVSYKPEPRTRIMSRDEEAAFREAMPEHWRRYLTVMLGTGLRAGELRFARPMDLRDNGAWLWVRPESNKTRKGRMVPLRPEVQQALKEQWTARDVTDPKLTYWSMSKGAAKMMFYRLCQRLKIDPPITVHALRRTFATRCADAGMYPRHLQKILGHSSIETTMRFYVAQEAQTTLDALMTVQL